MHDQNFQAGVMVQMGVAGRNNQLMMVVLQLSQLLSNAMCVVIIDQRHGTDNNGVRRRGAFTNQAITNEIAKCFRSTGIPASSHPLVELLEKTGIKCNADSAENAHMLS